MNNDFILVFRWNNSLQDYESVGALYNESGLENDDQNHGFVGFQYDTEYIHKGGASLDPLNLVPHINGGLSVNTTPKGGLHAYFHQFLPGLYANSLLRHYYEDWDTLTEFERLKRCAIAYGDHFAIRLDVSEQAYEGLPENKVQIKSLITQMREFEQTLDKSVLSNQTLMALCNNTGRRGKIQTVDPENGTRSLVRLNQSALYDDAKVFAVIADMQSQAGISTVNTGLLALDDSETVCQQAHFCHAIVRNPGESTKLFKFNTVAFHVLLENSRKTLPVTYQQAADIITQHSLDPQEDLRELFRRAYFNARINHVHNSLDNLQLIDLANNAWRLAPAVNTTPWPLHEETFKTYFGDNMGTRKLFNIDSAFITSLANTCLTNVSQAHADATVIDNVLANRETLYDKYDLDSQSKSAIDQAVNRGGRTVIKMNISANQDSGPRMR